MRRFPSIVPILSKKAPAKIKEQLTESFMNTRQETLDRFLQRIVHHPELVDAPCLLSFFTANPTDWIDAKESVKSAEDKDLLLKENTSYEDEADFSADSIQIDAHAAMLGPEQEKKKGPMGRWFANKRTAWALKNDNLELEETPAEAKKFADMKTYADHLEVCVRILSEDYKSLLSARAVVGEKTGTMGAAFAQMWGEHDLSNTSSSVFYQSLGKIWANSSHRIKNQVSFGERHFETPVDELILDIVALQDALVQRKASLYEFTKLTQEGKRLNKQLDRIRQSGNMPTQQDRYFKLESQLRHCDEKTVESRNHSDTVTTRLERDIERFRVEWHECMRQVLQAFHKEQVQFMERETKDFLSVLPALESLDSKRSDLATEAPQSEKLEINLSANSSGAIMTSIVGGNPGSAVMTPISPPPPPPPDDGEDLRPISLTPSFSSDDGGFDNESAAMGGEATESTSKPIFKSV